MKNDGNGYMVYFKLLSMTADMKAACDMAGVNNAKSNTCCRFCFATKERTGEPGFMYIRKWQRTVLLRNISLCEKFRRFKFPEALNKLGMHVITVPASYTSNLT